VAARSKAWALGRALAESHRCRSLSLVSVFVLSDRGLRRTDILSRGVVPSVMCPETSKKTRRSRPDLGCCKEERKNREGYIKSLNFICYSKVTQSGRYDFDLWYVKKSVSVRLSAVSLYAP
jgi:hypothetical protein